MTPETRKLLWHLAAGMLASDVLLMFAVFFAVPTWGRVGLVVVVLLDVGLAVSAVRWAHGRGTQCEGRWGTYRCDRAQGHDGKHVALVDGTSWHDHG